MGPQLEAAALRRIRRIAAKTTTPGAMPVQMGDIFAAPGAELLPVADGNKVTFAVIGCADPYFHADQSTETGFHLSNEIAILEGELLSFSYC